MRAKLLRERLRKQGVSNKMSIVLAEAYINYGIEQVNEEYRHYFRGLEGHTLESKNKLLGTICQKHRELYQMMIKAGYKDDSKEIRKLREAFEMGKKMVNKLRQYKYNFDRGWYDRHKHDGGLIEKGAESE